MEGFRRVPAPASSPAELMALTFSRGPLRPLEGTQLHVALDSALTKAGRALPPAANGYLEPLDSLFAIGLGSHVSYRKQRETIDKLTKAITKGRTVQLRYFSAPRNQTTRREVDPYRLVGSGQTEKVIPARTVAFRTGTDFSLNSGSSPKRVGRL